MSTLPTNRFKVEFFDGSGVKHSISLNGDVSREKINQILDYVELMGGTKSTKNNLTPAYNDTKFERIRKIIVSNFSDKVFISKEIQATYLEYFNDTIPLSTIATYLSRLVDKGFLHRGGSSGEWHYALSQITK